MTDQIMASISSASVKQTLSTAVYSYVSCKPHNIVYDKENILRHERKNY